MEIIDGVPVWGTPVDQSALAQIKNCAKTADHVALMADHHKGYAVPIGGVVAYEDKISPSGVGFDIACVAEGTPVVTGDGYWLPVEQMSAGHPALCWDGERVRPIAPHFGAVAKGHKDILRVRLTNGREMSLTADHRVRTKQGWQEAGTLNRDAQIACVPFTGLPHEAVTVEIPLELTPKHQEELTARGLFPLPVARSAFAALVRLLGVVSGDGHLTRNGKRISVYTTNSADAEDIRRDFGALGYDAAIHRRSRGPGRKEEHNVSIDSQALHALFVGLGAVAGKKVWPEAPMPWLHTAPAWVRAQFLSAFCSAEAATPRVSRSGFPNLAVKQAGENENAIRFIASLFRSLCFEVSVAPSGPQRGERRDYVLQVLGGAREQVRFLEEVGFCYAREKRAAAARVASAAWQLAEELSSRAAAHRETKRLKADGVYWRDIMAQVAERFGVSPGFVYHAIYDDRGSVRRSWGRKIVPDTDGEVCWVGVTDISPAGVRPVYDLVTGDPAEAFFANGLVVHNCGNKAARLDIPAAEVRANIKTIMDDVWKNLEFGIGRSNDTRVEHELFDDETWKLRPMKSHKQMAQNQLGTIGSGNHYLDFFVDEQEQVWVGAHFGSRGLGHKTATFFLEAGGAKDGMDVDPLVLDARSSLGSDYLACMTLAGRYAYAGRDWVCAEVARLLGATIVEEIHNHHNYAWRETHGGRDLWVVRKGATPAFPGQKGFVGGSMGDISVILEGVESSEGTEALYSTVHGAGRVMSRTAARGKVNRKTGQVISPGVVSRQMMLDWIRDKGVELRGAGTDESPHCYKRLPDVLEQHRNSVRILHTLTPVGVAMAGEGEVDPYVD